MKQRNRPEALRKEGLTLWVTRNGRLKGSSFLRSFDRRLKRLSAPNIKSEREREGGGQAVSVCGGVCTQKERERR